MGSQRKSPKANRLAGEKSPYLLQHAHNPVDWYPWGEEAFEKAKDERKPIFLSIGYSTCHWCHVMAHESFEDDDVAALMNEAFVNIKVDREERPDIDGVYMQIAQMITGRGGWPLTIIMTPDKKPFFAGTYIPKTTRYNTLGMLELIPRITEIWKNERNNIEEVINRIENSLQEKPQFKISSELTENDITGTFSELAQRFDDKHGGFGNAPKFPSPHNLLLILRYWKRTSDEWALHIVEKTLTEMRKGGIFDHLGYGFHRYSTDSQWLLPHFEKMLYDQAGLMMAYTEMYQITQNPFYSQVVEEIYQYVTRDLMNPHGGFYSAEDADSEGIEGKFYVWSEEEINDILTEEEKNVFCMYYNIYPEGNFIDEATRERTNLNIPHITSKVEDIVRSSKLDFENARNLIESGRAKLFQAREKRTRPHRDEKILTDWNGFMLSAIAKAGMALGNFEMIKTAEQSATFLLENLLSENGELYHRYSDGEVAHRAFLDDYAYFIMGLLDVYEATFNTHYLQQAKFLTEEMLNHFWDEEGGGLFFTGTYSEKLLVRRKDAYDGAMPSGNSIAMIILIRLARMLGDNRYEDYVVKIGKSFSTDIGRSHSAYSMMMVALDFALGPSYEIVVAGNPDREDTREMIETIREHFLPRKVVLFRGTAEHIRDLNQLAPFTKFHTPIRESATAHVCVNFNCKLPTNDVNQMLKLLE